MKAYLGLAISDSMFPAKCKVMRTPVTEEYIRELIREGELISVINPSHKATILALELRLGIKIPIPDKPPVVQLQPGDSFIVMSIRGLPRREGGKAEYTAEEVSRSEFEFGVWSFIDLR
jgi:hypothetical protein